MINISKRKKLLLEKHNRLAPIDDAQLKSKKKLEQAEADNDVQPD
jgi:hypothetical protein